MASFNKTDSKALKILAIVLAVVISLAAIGGVILGIINLVEKDDDAEIGSNDNQQTEPIPENSNVSNKYPTDWIGDSNYRYRLLSDCEMEIQKTFINYGSIKPTVEYFYREDDSTAIKSAKYTIDSSEVHFKEVYTYSIICSYETKIENGRTNYECDKSIYFPMQPTTPELVFRSHQIYGVDMRPSEDDVKDILNYASATMSLDEYIIVDNNNFMKYPDFEQEYHLFIYNDKYVTVDEIVISNK